MPPTPHVPRSAPPAPVTPAQSAETPGWETLELARHSAEAHATFQRLMTEAHLEYLRVIEALTGRPTSAQRRPATTSPASTASAAAAPAAGAAVAGSAAAGSTATGSATAASADAGSAAGTSAGTANAAAGRWGVPASTPNRRVWPAATTTTSPVEPSATTAPRSTAPVGAPGTVPAQPDRHSATPGNDVPARPDENGHGRSPDPAQTTSTSREITDPATGDRVTTDPAAGDPAAGDPKVGTSVDTGPAAGNPANTDRAPGNPAVTDQAPGNPATTDQAPGNAATTDRAPGNPTAGNPADNGSLTNGSAAGSNRGNSGPGNGSLRNSSLPNGNPANNGPENSSLANDNPANATSADGRPANGSTANGSPANGSPANGSPANGNLAAGDRAASDPAGGDAVAADAAASGGSAAVPGDPADHGSESGHELSRGNREGESGHELNQENRTEQDITDPGLGGSGIDGPPQGEHTKPGPDSAIDVDVVRLTMSWAQTPLGGLAPPGLHAGPVHVVDGGSGLGSAVAAELSSRGLAAEVATHPGLGGVIFLGGLARPATPDAAIAAQLTALWLARNGKDRGIFVTVADTVTGRAGPWLGGLVGLVGAVGRDRPSASAIAIECERGDRDPAAVAVLIADELTRGAGAQRVRVAADGTRSVGRLVSAGSGTPREKVIGPDSVIVASGEARGFCGAALIELARSAKCRLVLLGRTPLATEPEHLAGADDEVSLMRKFAAGTGGPDGLAGMRTRARAVLATREIRRTIAACVDAGAEARYVYADDRDADHLTTELDLVRAEWGPITGVLHCAEVVTDRRPGEKSAADADRALGTHLAGLPALLTATVQDPLDTLMLFSSVAGWSGDLGQGPQALIGATLDRIAEAEQRRRPGCLVRSLAWDPADGALAALTGETARPGTDAVPVHARAAAFVAELAVDGPAHIVLTPRSTVPDRAQPASVAVDSDTHPWLADHRPQDVAVLPLAAGLGWMAAAARVREQDAVLTGVRVLRSVSTEHPQTIGVTVFGREVWLSNDAGEPCFRAGFGAPGPDRDWRPTGDPARFPGSSVYAGRPLFHGPRLHVVRSLGEIGPEGVVGTVLGARTMGWPDDDLPVDLAALDGALQLSGVWAMDEHRPVLPMGVAECRIHRWGRLPGPALCIVADGHRDDRGARCDAALVGPDGELWAELLGIEFVAPLGLR